jgi:predicted MFS family arabinose efflux permease
MPLSNSIGMSFAKDENLGRKLGQLNAANTAALVAGSAILWLLFNFLKISFTVSFTIGAVAFLGAAVLLMFMNPKQTTPASKRFVFRKEYRLYYWLSFLFGARKQIFITFAPWVLVSVFKQKVTTMTILFFIIAVLSIFFKPFIGYLIDKRGERFVLASEAFLLIFVCLGYAFADNVIPGSGAIFIIFACYILDQLLAAVSMARATYLKKIVVREDDLSPTLSAGISIDHIVSMTIPFLGGYIWYSMGQTGYKYVFIGGAVIAVINLISTNMIRIGARTQEAECAVQND